MTVSLGSTFGRVLSREETGGRGLERRSGLQGRVTHPPGTASSPLAAAGGARIRVCRPPAHARAIARAGVCRQSQYAANARLPMQRSGRDRRSCSDGSNAPAHHCMQGACEPQVQSFCCRAPLPGSLVSLCRTCALGRATHALASSAILYSGLRPTPVKR